MAVELEKGVSVKKKPVKSKLSKPNPKQKQQQYSVEIGSNSVKVIKVDAKGKIAGIGQVPFSGEPIWTDKGWIDRLSQTVREAAREAKVPKGANIACSVVIGGPNVIMQRFTMPEISHQAMLENARHEIASYLPGAQSNFVVGAEVQVRREPEEDIVATMDVFVAAVPKDMATAVSTAVTWAGFKVINLDIYENARLRLVNRYCMIEGGVPRSFGILDLNSNQPNITLYLNGFFYSTHYFTGSVLASSAGNTIDEIESLMGSLESIKGSSSGKKTDVIECNVDAVLSEVTFVVDFIKYQERGTGLECLLIMGNTQSGFAERLSAGLDMPVYTPETWLVSGFADSIKGELSFYMDAYASGIPSLIIGPQHMMDVKTAVIVRKPGRRLVLIASAAAVVILSALFVGITIPFAIEQGLQGDYRALDREQVRVDAVVAAAPTNMQLVDLRDEVALYSTRLMGVHDFYAEFAQAGVIIPIIFQSGFTQISNVNVAEDNINVNVAAIEFEHVAEILEDLRAHPLFRTAGTSSVNESDTTDRVTGTAEFSVSVIMRRGMGGIFND